MIHFFIVVLEVFTVFAVGSYLGFVLKDRRIKKHQQIEYLEKLVRHEELKSRVMEKTQGKNRVVVDSDWDSGHQLNHNLVVEPKRPLNNFRNS